MPLVPVESRIAGHIRMLGILWLAISALRLIPGFFLLAVALPLVPMLPNDMPYFMWAAIQGVTALLWINLFAGAVAGWALLARQPWARTAGILVGLLNLWDLPFGAALGVYTLWVLLPATAERELESPQTASSPIV